MIVCPRCGRKVQDFPHARKAHGVSCIQLPETRSAGWGKKTRKVRH